MLVRHASIFTSTVPSISCSQLMCEICLRRESVFAEFGLTPLSISTQGSRANRRRKLLILPSRNPLPALTLFSLQPTPSTSDRCSLQYNARKQIGLQCKQNTRMHTKPLPLEESRPRPRSAPSESTRPAWTVPSLTTACPDKHAHR